MVTRRGLPCLRQRPERNSGYIHATAATVYSRWTRRCVGNLSASLVFWIATANLLQLRWKERDNGSSGHTTKPVLITKMLSAPIPSLAHSEAPIVARRYGSRFAVRKLHVE